MSVKVFFQMENTRWLKQTGNAIGWEGDGVPGTLTFGNLNLMEQEKITYGSLTLMIMKVGRHLTL